MGDQQLAARERVLLDTAAWLRRQDWTAEEESAAESLAEELEGRAGYWQDERTVVEVDGDGFPADWPPPAEPGKAAACDCNARDRRACNAIWWPPDGQPATVAGECACPCHPPPATLVFTQEPTITACDASAIGTWAGEAIAHRGRDFEEEHKRARWERLVRRWANKHPDLVCSVCWRPCWREPTTKCPGEMLRRAFRARWPPPPDYDRPVEVVELPGGAKLIR